MVRPPFSAAARLTRPATGVNAQSASRAPSSARARALSTARPARSSWPAGSARDDPDDVEDASSSQPGDQKGAGSKKLDNASLSQAEPDDPQVPAGGGNSYAPTMKGMSLKKSATAGIAFGLQDLRGSAGAQLKEQNAQRQQQSEAVGASRSRAGPSLEHDPPPASEDASTEEDPHRIQPKLETSPAAANSNAKAPTGPGMSNISSARNSALPDLGSNATSIRSRAIQQAERAIKAIHRGKGGIETAKEGVQAALRRMDNPGRSAELQEIAERAASLGVRGRRTDGQAAAEEGQFGNNFIPLPPPPRQKTILYLQNMKKQERPIVALTAYDFPSALAIRSADVDICLVGDSLANVALGYSTTQHISLQEMIYACQAVQRGIGSPILAASSRTPSPFMICDLPFGTFHASVEEGTRNAIRLIQEGKVEAVKIEGGEEVLPLIRNLTRFGIPVMGHIGLQPQKVASTSGYRVQGRTAREAKEIYEQAMQLQEAGVFSIVLECVPSRLAAYISEKLTIPTIGIGAGNKTDGQVLVMSDMVGELTSPAHILAGLEDNVSENATSGAGEENAVPIPHANAPAPPKFVRIFTPGKTTIGALRQAAVKAYVEAVRSRDFPSDNITAPSDAAGGEAAGAAKSEDYKMKKEEWQGFLQLLKDDATMQRQAS